MQVSAIFLFMLFSVAAYAQEERDTVFKRCPVFITDTATSNNFFIEARPATMKVYRVKGDLTVVVEQKDQFFTLFFQERKLRDTKFRINPFPRGKNEVAVKYSFRTDDQVSYVNVGSGTVDVFYDKETEYWMVKVNGLIANQVGRSISYYKVKADLPLK
jgi:hypothetical protein